MRKQITLANPSGERFEVSTIATMAGGARPERFPGVPFTMADYEDCNTWPFETMVFPEHSRKGLFHRAYSSKQEAELGHAEICEWIRNGTEFPGDTVTGDFGIPSLTPEEWREAQAARGERK